MAHTFLPISVKLNSTTSRAQDRDIAAIETRKDSGGRGDVANLSQDGPIAEEAFRELNTKVSELEAKQSIGFGSRPGGN